MRSARRWLAAATAAGLCLFVAGPARSADQALLTKAPPPALPWTRPCGIGGTLGGGFDANVSVNSTSGFYRGSASAHAVPYLGAFADCAIGKFGTWTFGVEPRLDLSYAQTPFSGTAGGAPVTSSGHLGTLDALLLFKISRPLNSTYDISLFAGPGLSELWARGQPTGVGGPSITGSDSALSVRAGVGLAQALPNGVELGWEAYWQHTNATQYDTTMPGEGFRYGASNSVMLGLTVACCASPSSRTSAMEHLTPSSDQTPAPRKKLAATESGASGRQSQSAPQPSRSSNGPSGVPPRGERHYVANEIITSFVAGTSPQAIGQIAQRYNLTQLETQNFPLIGTALYRWRLNGRRSLAGVIAAIEREPAVASAQPNYVFTLQQAATGTTAPAPGDPAQYVLAKMQVQEAQKIATGKNVAVAVIDSEVDQANKELAGSIAKTFDALGGSETPHQHGTGMAGAIAAHSRLLGIAPDAQLYMARSFAGSDSAKGTSFAVYKSLEWAADNGVRLINMSFAGPNDPAMHRFLDAAYRKDIVLVAAAGNAGPNAPPLYPGSDADVIAVTATDSNDIVFRLANRGDYIAIAAPGVDIMAAAPGGSYQFTSGTSIAAAHVSGAVALMLQKSPALKPKDVRDILTKAATPLGPKQSRAEVGAGLANAYQAVKALDTGTAGAGKP